MTFICSLLGWILLESMRLNNLFGSAVVALSFLLIIFSCNKKSEVPYVPPYDQIENPTDTDNETPPQSYNILSLGDSYTIGQSVCQSCRFPEQLKDSLSSKFNPQDTFSLEIIAQTGWTTTNLKSAIVAANPPSDQDLVTLLIGVNNQYQNRPFSLYENEFVELVNTAIALAGGDASKLIVVSIPDYAYTPFGQNYNPEVISQELEVYNQYAQNYCENNGLNYVYITDITQQGLINPDLVASDNLHPSALAYTKFVERILPLAIDILEE